MTQHSSSYHEKALLLAIGEGDAMAFRRLFETYKDRIYSYAMHYTHHAEAAEELVQEVFMKVWLHREKLSAVDNFEAWVFTISRNLSFNYLRKIAREHALQRGLAAREESSPDLSDELLLGKEYEKLLQAAIDRLPPQQKLVYTLYRDRQLKQEEIALELGIARTTVSNHLAQAQRSIRTYLHAYIEPGTLLFLLLFPW